MLASCNEPSLTALTVPPADGGGRRILTNRTVHTQRVGLCRLPLLVAVNSLCVASVRKSKATPTDIYGGATSIVLACDPQTSKAPQCRTHPVRTRPLRAREEMETSRAHNWVYWAGFDLHGEQLAQLSDSCSFPAAQIPHKCNTPVTMVPYHGTKYKAAVTPQAECTKGMAPVPHGCFRCCVLEHAQTLSIPRTHTRTHTLW